MTGVREGLVSRHPMRRSRRDSGRKTMTGVGEGLAHRVLLRLAQSLHRYGTPTHRLEEAVETIANGMGLSVQVFSMPTGSFVAFEEESGAQKMHLLGTSNGDLHLEKQSAIDALVDRLIEGESTPEEVLAALDVLEQEPERFSWWLMVFAFGLGGLAVARMLNGSWLELVLSGMGGLVVGGGLAFFARWPQMLRLAPAFLSMATAFLLVGAGKLWGPFAWAACHLSAVIMLVPGLSLTIAMVELSTQHLVSGTARLAGACTVLFQLGFGLAVGRLLGEGLFGDVVERVSGAGLPSWTYGLALVLASASFLVLFRARPRDGFWILVAGVVAVSGAEVGVMMMGPRLGSFFGAFFVGVASNLFARVLRRPSSIMLIPGVVFLVPGSVGLTSISKLMNQHTLEGMQAAFSMFMIAVSLVFGVLMATLILPPRRLL